MTACVGGYDPGLFAAVAAVEDASFWFRARNRLILSTLQREFPAAQSLLDAGCGTGFVLAAIRRALPELHLVGTDLFDAGIAVARRRVPDVELVRADICALPYDGEFDVVCALDVLEHVQDDEAALAALARASRPNGGVVLLVPQHPRLWSPADEAARHVRRYTRSELTRKVERAGLAVTRATSFVTTLLPALVVLRRIRRRRPYDVVGELVPPGVNGVLERILGAETRVIARGVSLPVGASLLVVARRPG
jgi:SAM-dependent methyltransferase